MTFPYVFPFLRHPAWAGWSEAPSKPLLALSFPASCVPRIGLALFEGARERLLGAAEIGAGWDGMYQRALMNLATRQVAWEELDATSGFLGMGRKPIVVRILDALAAERILLPAFRQEVHQRFGARRVLAGVPERGVLVLHSYEEEHRAKFTDFFPRTLGAFHAAGGEPLSPAVFVLDQDRIELPSMPPETMPARGFPWPTGPTRHAVPGQGTAYVPASPTAPPMSASPMSVPPAAASPALQNSGANPAVAAAIAALGGRIDEALLARLRLQAHPSLRALIATEWEGRRFAGNLGGRRVDGLAFASGESTFDVGLGIRVATSDDRKLGYVVPLNELQNPDPPVLWYDFPSASTNPHGAPRGPAAPSLSMFLRWLAAAPAAANAPLGDDPLAGIPVDEVARGFDADTAADSAPPPRPAPDDGAVVSRMPNLAAVIEHMRAKYGPPPVPQRTPETESEAERLRTEGMLRAHVADYRGAIASFDAAMLKIGETPDLLAARAMAFLGLEEIAWYFFDMRDALDRAARGEPLSLGPDERDTHRQMLDKILSGPAGVTVEVLGPRRRADTFYSRGFRAAKEERPREALAWFAEALAVVPIALACWYGALFLAKENDPEPSLFLLDLLEQRPPQELAHLYNGVSRADVELLRTNVVLLAEMARE